LKVKVVDFLKSVEQLENPDAVALNRNFEQDSPFEGLKSLDQQIDVLSEKFNYIHPLEVPVSDRIDQRLDSKSGKFRP